MKLRRVKQRSKTLICLSSTEWAVYLLWSFPGKVIRFICPLGFVTLRWHIFDRKGDKDGRTN